MTTTGSITKRAYGTTSDVGAVDACTLTSAKGHGRQNPLTLEYPHQLQVPDRSGKLEDVVLGCSNVADYETKRAPISRRSWVGAGRPRRSGGYTR